ncbi:MAG: hypothetical protein A3F82_02655 [Deltaproteobacteria bacterium RIFCSPLOWO2_12_FULL_44_12]|nr:MAG: hypothetical protein A2712_10800 [Deltaproteobacteria bacterium RIFCSPHIGHO2_01_FULL_43_49]OGQ16542.1 MAG: hypothetical protein A3D22_06500 [Deltaproteobacteria bacterium RIFCSPHIGHO2_02_FULL_44_53]OGQ32430.1 MAG: hypothetical protein A2979_10765 [Deltaproteobacteria bacterium RIFCSPLOWO2_01_FULL_45_74]OGQ41555.1 MAG: hypothetical protein A3I70_05110 [Deltaproteobacteria bacterium RIFCSPLOWO2_02_FULL_44_34]OGQ69488.1 MAG: hypothetical protein A3F82_02655 [Deltaproteobacteria bacterium R
MEKEKTHLKVVGMLALLEGKEEAITLLDYIQPEFGATLQAFLESFKKEEIPSQLKALRAQESFSGIAEVHPAWLVEALKRESPRVIGVILRHLPSKHVRYLLEHLPKRIVMQLPKLVEAFYVPTEILNLIRRRFERHFVPMRISRQRESFGFHQLYCLKIEELELLFRELGLSELALSMVGSGRKILQMVLNRFGIQDAKEILHRIKRFSPQARWLLKDAKYSVLELNSDEKGVEHFLKELGLEALAKAMSPADSFFFEALKQKLSPENAYLFKRCMDEQALGFSPEKGTKRKEWVVEHVLDLSKKGKIDSIRSGESKREAA